MEMILKRLYFIVILNQVIKYIQSERDCKNFQEIKYSVIPKFQCPIRYKSCAKHVRAFKKKRRI